MPSTFRLLSDWVESNGGPLLLASLDSARVWQGGFWEDELSHYRAACEVGDLTGLVVVEGHGFAVLNELPLPTVAARYDDWTLLIRGLCAESDDVLLSTAADWVSQFDPRSAPTCEIAFACRAETLVLFDAAYKGTGDHGGATFLTERPAKSIRTYWVKLDEQTEFLVDWLV